jgi:CRISPR-associated protein Csx17
MKPSSPIPLNGCAPVPLAHYLKALGILRLVAEQVDPAARGRWCGEQFELYFSGDRESLVKFFVTDYRPTPVLAPWNGGSGFFPKDNDQALYAIGAGRTPRLEHYRGAIAAAPAIGHP